MVLTPIRLDRAVFRLTSECPLQELVALLKLSARVQSRIVRKAGTMSEGRVVTKIIIRVLCMPHTIITEKEITRQPTSRIALMEGTKGTVILEPMRSQVTIGASEATLLSLSILEAVMVRVSIHCS